MVEGLTDLLSVVGCVREHGGHVKHQLVVLVGGVERVRASGVRWKTKQARSFKISAKLHVAGLAGCMLSAHLTLVIQLRSVLGEAFEAHPLA